MNLRERCRDWRRKRRRSESSRGGELREFVYLDDVSVYSLLASRRGWITTDMTETESASLQSEVSASAGANALIGKAEIGSRIQAGNSSGTQIVRKAIIQSSFKEWYALESEELVLRPVDQGAAIRTFDAIEDLERSVTSEEPQAGIVHSKSLRRGCLVEVEVELEAAPIFNVVAVMTGVLDVIRDAPRMFGIRQQDFAEMAATSGVLDKLLGGLIPVRGRVIGYDVVAIGGKDVIVDRRALANLAEEPTLNPRPLVLTGVAEHALFWKDIRRILFAKSTYKVLARVASSGLSDEWTPVKLVDVLRTVAPTLADSMDAMNYSIATSMGGGTDGPGTETTQMAVNALVKYGTILVEGTKSTIDGAAIRELLTTTVERMGVTRFGSRAERLSMFAAITTAVEKAIDEPVDKTMAAMARTQALTDAGFTVDGQPVSRPSAPPHQDTNPPKSADRFLDTELIAIYW